jgi:hypothetical protein
MPDFAKHHREMIANRIAYSVAVRFMPWSSFELSNGMPLTMPTPHCIGCLMVFDNDDAAKEWADGGEVLHILTSKEKADA